MAQPETIFPNAVTSSAETLVWEPKDEEIYELSGVDRKNFLNSYVTQDIKNLGIDRIAAAAFLTQKGKLVSTARVLNLPDRILLFFPQGYGARIEAHLATYLMFANVTLKKMVGKFSQFALCGPKARGLLQDWLGAELPDQDRSIFRSGDGESETLAFPDLNYPDGWRILATDTSARALRERISVVEKSGAAVLADAPRLELLRIEAGVPKMGTDMGEDNLVAEVGLDASATSFNKGCYLGQETTARVQSRGHVNRKLTQVRIDQAFSGSLPVELFQGEKKVGLLTSAVESPKYGGWIGLATVALSAWESSEPIFAVLGKQRITKL